ncbi:MAG: excinuclease ABC subunit UvrC [Clostridia bacterium]|nr:excinuclease ABC subunit UvrC [Clostridia bacterium]
MTKLKELHKKATALPEQPGVYLMKNRSGAIIYIGKAKNLKNRVSQYFGNVSGHTVKVRSMVENVHDFDYIIVGSEFEALVLECSLIKQNKPKYNILLKDDKGYYYIRHKTDGWQSISAVKQKADDGAEYLGPYTASEYVSNAVKQALDIYLLPHCGKTFPQDISKNARPCLNFYIHLCAGACCGKITEAEHNANVASALHFITDGKAETLKRLREEMARASEETAFEKAAKLRDKIKAIEKVTQRQHVVAKGAKDLDIFGAQSLNEKTCLCVLKFREGDLAAADTFIFDRIEQTAEEYTDIISSYYAARGDYPSRVGVDIPSEELDLLRDFLSESAGRKVEVFTPKAGENRALIEMAHKNAQEKLARVLAFDDKKKAALHELQELLGLDRFPEYIESYDISNTGGEENVGGMVVFRNGRPLKKNYRKFKIKSFEGQDDFRSLAEVLDRRIGEYYLDPDSGEGFGVKPDLILLDGGEGQVSAVKAVLEARGFDVPLFGLVKDGKHRTRAIAGVGREIAVNDNRSVFTLVSEIQEEVHRYAISFHRSRRDKNPLASSLTVIDGVGEARARKLMVKFKTVSRVADATMEELTSVPGIDRKTAENICEYFRAQKR